MNALHFNVFIVGTEYHFLLAMSIVQEYFSADTYLNKFVFLGKRLSDIDPGQLPPNVTTQKLYFDEEKNFKEKVHTEILNGPLLNLFVVNAYRTPETYILSAAPKSVRRHLIQDGALFYNKIEKSIYKNRIKEMSRIYWRLWKKGIFFTDLIFYGRYMETSGYIDELWMTNPDIYIGPKTKKKINHIRLFSRENSAQVFSKYFRVDQHQLSRLDNYLIYLSVIIRNPAFYEKEVDQIRNMLKKIDKSNVLIKLHPNSSPAQYDVLKRAFGEMVFKNHVPAEVYIANARRSYVVGCASTSLFYNNPECQYFALKKFYQELGIYSKWYNIKLPEHVKVVESLEDLS